MEEKKTKTEEKKKVARKPRAVKPVSATKPVKSEITKKTVSDERYTRSLGRRKEATAIAKIFVSKKEIKVNGKTLNDYFKVLEMQKIVQDALKVSDLIGKVGVEITTRGGGMRGQAEAARLAIARALVKQNQEYKRTLKLKG
ncbi:MAG: 30S ribosomal protein S9, partial [Candidatus Brennerbacteria bacterium RIFOXYB1_FULL_41_13]